MKKIISVFILIGLIGLIFHLWSDLHQTETISETCTLSLKIFTRQGTNAKYNVSGWVLVDGTNSTFDGSFFEEKEASYYPITLYFDRPVIHFVLNTKHGRIFGEGTSDSSSVKICSGKASGRQSGPILDDKGNWQGKWKHEEKKIPPPPLELIVFKWVCIGLIGLPITFGVGWLMGKRSTKEE